MEPNDDKTGKEGKGMEINDVIKSVRESKGLTQQDAADKLGVDVSTIIRWEKRGSTIKMKFLQELAELYELSVGNFYSYVENPSLLKEPIQFYHKSKNKVSVLMELDGSDFTLAECLNTLKRLNAALI